MTTTYNLTSAKIDGYLELTYDSGVLNIIKMVLKTPLNDKQFRSLVEVLPQYENQLDTLKPLGLKTEVAMPANIKLDLFCRKYEQYKGIKYHVSAADSGKIKLIKINEPLLDSYYTSDNFLFKNKHSVSNLVRNYNELLAEIAAGDKMKHPNYWSAKHAAKVDGTPAYKEYINHLHEIGLKPKKNWEGQIIDWEKK